MPQPLLKNELVYELWQEENSLFVVPTPVDINDDLFAFWYYFTIGDDCFVFLADKSDLGYDLLWLEIAVDYWNGQVVRDLSLFS